MGVAPEGTHDVRTIFQSTPSNADNDSARAQSAELSKASHDASNFLDMSGARRVNATDCYTQTAPNVGHIFLPASRPYVSKPGV
jgi:hypothetical protein